MDLRRFRAITISTFFYVGFLPFIPGTFGSLTGLLLYYLVKRNGLLYLLAASVVIVLGFLFSSEAEKALGSKDARPIVIDEVSGMLIALMFLPFDYRLVIIGFFLFRLLDTVKPFPASRLEKAQGSLGIMGDDIIAGAYTNIILQLVLRLASFKIS